MTRRGSRIRHLRNSADLTQEKFGEIFNVKKNTVSQWESEVSEPDDEMKKRICKHFDCSLDWLLGMSDIKNPLVHQALKDNPELMEFWETMQEREDLQLMFKKSKVLTPDAVRKIIEIIKLIEDNEKNE